MNPRSLADPPRKEFCLHSQSTVVIVTDWLGAISGVVTIWRGLTKPTYRTLRMRLKGKLPEPMTPRRRMLTVSIGAALVLISAMLALGWVE